MEIKQAFTNVARGVAALAVPLDQHQVLQESLRTLQVYLFPPLPKTINEVKRELREDVQTTEKTPEKTPEAPRPSE